MKNEAWDAPVTHGKSELPYTAKSLASLPAEDARKILGQREALYYTENFWQQARTFQSGRGLPGHAGMRCIEVTEKGPRWQWVTRCPVCTESGNGCGICDGDGYIPAARSFVTDFDVTELIEEPAR